MSQITPLTEVQAARSPRDLRSRLDFWQALSGACLALFVCFHLIFEGSVVISPAITDWIGWAMEVTYVAQIAAPVVLLLIISISGSPRAKCLSWLGKCKFLSITARH